MVSKLVNALLTSNRSTQDWFYAKQLPKGLFAEGASQMHWIYAQKDLTGAYPTVSAFKHRFPAFDLEPRNKDTLEQCLQPLLDKAVFNEMTAAVASTKALYTSGESPSAALAHLRAALASVVDYSTTSIDIDFSKTKEPDLRYRGRVAAFGRGDGAFDPSPWAPLNELVGYSEPGEHSVIASRTSIGKSWLLLRWAKHFVDAGERVLVVSKEMSTAQITDRYEALQFRLDYPAFRKGLLPPAELRRWRLMRRKFPLDKNLIITGQETVKGVGFAHITSKVQQYQPTVLFVDGAYLIYPEEMPRNGSDVQRFTIISNTMKRLSKAFKVRGFSAIQINRAAETADGDTKASLSQIYGSDAWAQDADNVILISGRRGSSRRLVSLAKGRESNVGEFNVSFKLSPFPEFESSGVKFTGDETDVVHFKTAKLD